MPNIPIIDTFVGDSAPDITITVTRDDGSIVDLTGCTVKFRILDPKTGLRTNDSNNTCSLTYPLQGICVYTRVAGDLPDQGVYTANLQITHINGKVETSEVQIVAASTV